MLPIHLLPKLLFFMLKCGVDGSISIVKDFTRILEAARHGDPQASEELLPLVYDELRRLSASKMAKECAPQTLQATALVHEAWLRLNGNKNQEWENRAHFFAAAAEAMRRILIDNARRKKRVRHGGDLERIQSVDWDSLLLEAGEVNDEQLLCVDEAVEKLARDHPQCAEFVKLRFFTRMTIEEAAETMGIGETKAKKIWRFAKAWLSNELRLV